METNASKNCNLILYVDNSIIIGNDMELLHATKKCLTIGFEMTNKGPIKDVGLVKMMWR